MGSERGVTVWLTGLPSSGKSSIARLAEAELRRRGRPVEILDGDAVREHLSKGLGFSRADRDTNVQRMAFVAQLLTRHGVLVLVAAISPYAQARGEARSRIGDFIEVHVDCPLAECERRDVKGLYAKARAGVICAFTGVSDPYEAPVAPELVLSTLQQSPEQSAGQLLSYLEARGYVPPAGAEPPIAPGAPGR